MPTRIVESDGLRICTESIGSGQPIVFVHGLTGSRSGAIQQFRDQGHRYQLITYDQRGHGDSSPVTDPNLYDPNQMAGDMRAVLDSYGVERSVVGGESMGAATALLYALRWPDRVDALLLTVPAFGPSPNPDRQTIWDMGDLIEKHGVDGYMAQTRGENRYDLSEEALAVIRERLMLHDTNSIAAACKTVIDWVIISDMNELERLSFPVCIVAWKDDPLHPYALAEEMASVIPQATLITHTIEEQFTNPGRTGEIYASFLAGLP